MKRRACFWLPFIALIAAMALSDFVSNVWPFPGLHLYLYPVRMGIVFLTIVWVWDALPVMRLLRPFVSFLVGAFVFVLWIGLDPFLPGMENQGAYNPFLAQEWWLVIFLMVVRTLGAVVVAPVAEELFWRGFLMRFIIRQDYEKGALGEYRHLSFWGTAVAMALVHHQWALGLMAGVLYGAWFVRTKSLGDVIFAHAVTNLLLAVYVVSRQEWHFW